MADASVKTNEVKKYTSVRFLSALVLLAVAACELLLLSTDDSCSVRIPRIPSNFGRAFAKGTGTARC
jgi:hypothetical protein